jgi:hypothetical protein
MVEPPRGKARRRAAALHRLPEPVLLAAEGLWLQALDDARRRAAAEQGTRKTSLARERQDLEVRSHLLSIREKEIIDRLKQSESRVAAGPLSRRWAARARRAEGIRAHWLRKFPFHARPRGAR